MRVLVTWSIKHSLRLLSHAGPSCHKIYHAYEKIDIQEYKDRKINFLKVLQESPLCGAHFLQTDDTITTDVGEIDERYWMNRPNFDKSVGRVMYIYNTKSRKLNKG